MFERRIPALTVRIAASIALVLLLCGSLLAQKVDAPPKYKNPKLPLDQRVDDLVSRMTLEEKVSQMMDVAPAIPRLDIPAYNWWNEALHGVARAGIATVFPQAIGLAATWDTPLMHRVADTISTEARAKYNDAIANDDHSRYRGLTFWSPNINIFRDPRWGRGQETYGEDPYLTARMGVEFVKGLQGDDPTYFKTISTPKHYAVHSGPEPDRHKFDAVIGERDLHDTYLPAFEATVEQGHAFSVMCAYNSFMGAPACANDILLKKNLRGAWKFPGYVVSDCGAINDIYGGHKAAPNAATASAMAVKAGTDLECGRSYRSLVDAAKQGLIAEKDIDVALKRLFTARFKLGMFDPPEMVPYSKTSMAENDTPEHRQLALQAARESIVLLKNENNTLPLKKDLKKIAIIGPNADELRVMLGNYNGTPSSYITPLKGIQAKVSAQTQVVYEQGCNLAIPGPTLHLVPATAFSTDGQPGLKAEYFGNRNLEGKPVFTRIDSIVDSNWAKSPPVPGIGRNDFSIRWTGTLTSEFSGQHVLAITGDDGYRLWVDGALVIDNWSIHGPDTRSTSIELQAGHHYNIKLEYFQDGGDAEVSFRWGEPAENEAARAVNLARESDAVIFVGGISPSLEGEEMKVSVEGFVGGDRTSLDLPKTQRDLLEAVAAAGKPVVLVLTSGSALAVNWANEHAQAIVQLWYSGEEGGNALADVLFGDYNPAGRLPVTFYKSVDQLPPFDDYKMAGRTYRYFKGEPLYSFGYGLSYTNFAYSNLAAPKQAKAGENVTVTAQVKNTGSVAGEEVVELYVKHDLSSVVVPIRSLEGFSRISLAPGQSRTVSFTLTPRELSIVDEHGKRIVEPGDIEVSIGGGQPGAPGSSGSPVTGKLIVTGKPFVVE
ncbi:MAG TPA: glycoside hydrolase family 3 C-terminal domain-containing protein [Blastocatellia bacterium]|nr:glycoside hydrolase family 3 C-terminal domain-containing protein [Blastocatellia bacterium]